MEIGNTKKLADILAEQGQIKPDVAKSLEQLSNLDQEKKLLAEQALTPEIIARGYGLLYQLPFVALGGREIQPEALAVISENLAKQYKIIGYDLKANEQNQKVVSIAVAEPGKLTQNLRDAITNLEKQKNLKIELTVTTPTDFEAAVKQYHQTQHASVPPGQTKTVNLTGIIIPYQVITKFPQSIALKYQMLVFEAPSPHLIKVAVAEPENQKVKEILDFVKTKNNIAIELYRASPAEIDKAMRFYDPEESKPKPPPPKVAPPPTSHYQPRTVATEEKPATETISVGGAKIDQIAAEAQKAPLRQKVDLKELESAPPPAPAPAAPAAPAPTPSQIKEELKPTPPPPPKEEPVLEVKSQNKAAMETPVENDLDKFLGETVNEAADLQRIGESGNVPKIIAAAIILAVKKKSSDIHIEASEKNVRIRFRVDGLLKDVIKLPKEFHPPIISRVKILSKLKIDESRIPQDGRFDCVASGHAIDLRISTLPTVHGEKIVMRILDKSAHLFTLEELGMVGHNLKVLVDNMDKPYGLILSTGPTGSGKTTTLYAVLNRVSNATVNIITLEDPVEYNIGGINQCQIRPKIGFTFANGLRSILRQDPNIIMVGEIRDSETAALATQAALTGHLVLSTLHTNDAAGTLPRLADLRVEPFFITSLINAIIGQRLVRRLCPKCKRQAHIPAPILKEIEGKLEKFNLPKPYQFFEGAGCNECEQGYKGRVGIFEVLTMSLEIERLVLGHKGANEIKEAAIKNGMITMEQDGLIKALKGVTTVNEVMRVITV